MVNNISKFLILVPLLSVGSFCFAGDWHLVYQNDASGNSVYGNIQILSNAAQSGSDIKIQQDDSKSHYSAVCRCNTTILSAVAGKPQVICLVSSDIATDAASFSTGKPSFQNNAYYDFMMFSTTGYSDESRYFVNGTVVPNGHTHYRYGLKWFID